MTRHSGSNGPRVHECPRTPIDQLITRGIYSIQLSLTDFYLVLLAGSIPVPVPVPGWQLSLEGCLCLSYIQGASICSKIQSLPSIAYLTLGLRMQPVSRPLRCSSHQDRHSSMKPIFGPAYTTKCCQVVAEQRVQCIFVFCRLCREGFLFLPCNN